ncbi:MAG: hypothetical protein LBF22_06230, partial [Deltaproteobacteria bacterium]|nr:hypothetical protein [Deltaproteobacteria bacterium]
MSFFLEIDEIISRLKKLRSKILSIENIRDRKKYAPKEEQILIELDDIEKLLWNYSPEELSEDQKGILAGTIYHTSHLAIKMGDLTKLKNAVDKLLKLELPIFSSRYIIFANCDIIYELINCCEYSEAISRFNILKENIGLEKFSTNATQCGLDLLKSLIEANLTNESLKIYDGIYSYTNFPSACKHIAEASFVIIKFFLKNNNLKEASEIFNKIRKLPINSETIIFIYKAAISLLCNISSIESAKGKAIIEFLVPEKEDESLSFLRAKANYEVIEEYCRNPETY